MKSAQEPRIQGKDLCLPTLKGLVTGYDKAGALRLL